MESTSDLLCLFPVRAELVTPSFNIHISVHFVAECLGYILSTLRGFFQKCFVTSPHKDDAITSGKRNQGQKHTQRQHRPGKKAAPPSYSQRERDRGYKDKSKENQLDMREIERE